MNSRKRICIAAVNIPPNYGGAGRGACRYARYLAARGEDVLLVTNTPSPEPIEGVEVVSVDPPLWYFNSRIFGMPYPVPGIKHVYDPIILFKLCAILDPAKIGVVHCKSGQWFPLLVLTAARRKGIPSIVQTTLLDGDDPFFIGNQWLGSLKLKMYKQADLVVNKSPALLDRCRLANISPEKCELIPNSVDVSRFMVATEEEKNSLRQQLGLQHFSHVLLTVGLLTPRKKTADILETFRQVSDSWPDACLAIVGPTDNNEENSLYTKHIKNLAKKYGLENRVLISGRVPNVDEWMRASDIFLFASEREGLANVYLEALSSGLPAVVKRIEGITDYVFDDSSNGFIFDDLSEASRKVALLLSDPQKHRSFSEGARRTAVERFSESVVMQKWKQVYEKIGVGLPQ